MRKYSELFLLLLIIGLALVFRLYQLDKIPGEMWGDIGEGYEFSASILEGKWPFYFVLGNGPLFFYIVSALAIVIGLSFMTMKITSVAVGMVFLIGTYFLGKEISNKWVGLLAAFFVAVSRWPVTFSRWGNMNILVPTFIVFIFYFLFRAIKYCRTRDFVFVGLLTGVGLFNYPAFLFVPIALGLILLYCLLFKREFIVKNKLNVLASIVVFVPFALYFYTFVVSFEFTNSSSYFGSKFFAEDGKVPADVVPKLIRTTLESFGMFHVRGDEGFRANIATKPHIDTVSGILLLVGAVGVFIKKELKKWAFLLFIPFILLQLPVILVINVPSDVPNITRSIGILPFLYVFIATGAYLLFVLLARYLSPRIVVIIGMILLSVIALQNWREYFVSYAQGLPNRNTPFGKIIAARIDALPLTRSVAFVGCCWGDWGQPEIPAVRYMLKKPRIIDDLSEFVCIDKAIENTTYYVNPQLLYSLRELQICYPEARIMTIKQNSYDVVVAVGE